MANTGIDLEGVWKNVMNLTQKSSSGSLGQDALKNLAESVISGAKAKLGDKLDLAAIATQLMSLYTKYKASANSTEKTAANNVKGLSDIIGALGGDKGSLASAGASILGNIIGGKTGDSDKAQAAAKGIGSVLGKLFGKK